MSSPGTLRHILVRRWYITLGGLLLTVGLVFMATILVPATYKSKANMLLLQDQAAVAGTGQNPFVTLSGYLPFTDVVARAMQDTKVSTELQALGVHDAYTVERDLTTNGPVLLITIDGRNAGDVSTQLGLIVDQVPKVLAELQSAENVPQTAQITSRTILQQQVPSTIRKSQYRAALVAMAAGILATVGVASLTERIIDGRRARRSRRADDNNNNDNDNDTSAPPEPIGEIPTERVATGMALRPSPVRRTTAPGGRRRRASADRQAS